MVSLFADPRNLPLECIHTHHQYPYTIRVVSPWVVQSAMRIDVKVSSTEKSFRKYFGKNVRKLICIQTSPSFKPGYRCKFLRTARLNSLPTVKYNLRQVENLHVNDTNFWIYDRYREVYSRKVRPGFGKITSHKCMKYLEADFGWLDIQLKPIRALTKLQVLSLTMNEDMFTKNYRVMLSVKALKKLNLSIISTRAENPLTNQSESPIFSDFLIEATKLKKLDYLGLKLNLFDRIGTDSKPRFFEALNKIDIPAFSIELTEMDVHCISPEVLRNCTKNIDLLELDLEKDVSVSIVCGTENITGKVKRKLKMSFKFKSASSCLNSGHTESDYSSQNKGLPAIQAEANSLVSDINMEFQILKRIDLTSKLEILANDCLGIPFSLSGESNMKYLKSFSLNFVRMLETMSEEIDQVLLTILENENNLEHLQLREILDLSLTNLMLTIAFH